MNPLFRMMLAITGLSTGVLFTATAHAQCNAAARWQEPQLHHESWSGSFGVRLRYVDSRRDDDSDDIVGFWNTTLTAKGNVAVPDGVIDRGLQQWHADGTEFLNSSAQHPLTQNFCMGVWKKVGPLYVLNHFAYNYDAGQNLIGLTSIREEVAVNHDGKTFTGVFAIQGYDTLRNKVGPLVKGLVKGKRIEADTSPQDIL